LARASVSKTEGWGFETLHSCHSAVFTAQDNHNIIEEILKESIGNKGFFKRTQLFLSDVKKEGSRVTWPKRKETIAITISVFILALIAAAYFLIVDRVILLVLNWIMGLGT